MDFLKKFLTHSNSNFCLLSLCCITLYILYYGNFTHFGCRFLLILIHFLSEVCSVRISSFLKNNMGRKYFSELFLTPSMLSTCIHHDPLSALSIWGEKEENLGQMESSSHKLLFLIILYFYKFL